MKQCPYCNGKLVPKGKQTLGYHIQIMFACVECKRWFHVYEPKENGNKEQQNEV